MSVQAVIAKDVSTAGVRRQNRRVGAVGALGGRVHGRGSVLQFGIRRPGDEQLLRRVFQVVEVNHGQAGGEEFHEAVPQQLPGHVRVADVPRFVGGRGGARDPERVLDDAWLRAPVQEDQQVDKLEEFRDVRDTVEQDRETTIRGAVEDGEEPVSRVRRGDGRDQVEKGLCPGDVGVAQVEQLLAKGRLATTQRVIPYKVFEKRVDLGLPSIDPPRRQILADLPRLTPQHLVDLLVQLHRVDLIDSRDVRRRRHPVCIVSERLFFEQRTSEANVVRT